MSIRNKAGPFVVETFFVVSTYAVMVILLSRLIQDYEYSSDVSQHSTKHHIVPN